MTNDGNLLREYSERNSERAFAELVQRHVDFVYGVALRQLDGNVHRAKDVVQCVFADLARKAGPLSDRVTLVGWLHISVHHAAAQLRRSEQRRKRREEEAHIMQEHLRESASQPDWEHLRPVLDTAISELSDPDREAVLLRFFEQRPFAEIGATLQIGEEASRKRVARALDRLHSQLARRGITSTAAAIGTLLANQIAIAAPAGFATAVTSAALAAGATGSGISTTVGLLKFMSTTKIITTAATVIAFIALGSAVYQANASRESAAELVAIGKERDDLRARLSSADKKIQQTQQESAAIQKREDSAPKPSKVTETQNSRPTTAPTSARDYILDHPETHANYVQQETLRAKAKFERFFQVAGLSTEQQTEFLKQMKANAEAKLDLMVAARAQGFGSSDVPQDPQAALQLANLEKETDANAQKRLQDALGADLYKQYREYSNTIPERNVVGQLASQLYYNDAPLTREQADQLTQILAENRFSRQSNVIGGVTITPQVYSAARLQAAQQGSSLDWNAPITDAAFARAQTVLAPSQMAALREVQAQQTVQLQLAPPLPRMPVIPKPSGNK